MKTWFVYYQDARGYSGMNTIDALTKAEARSAFLRFYPGCYIESITDI